MKANGIAQVLKVNDTAKLLFPLHRFNIEVMDVHLEDHHTYELDVETEVLPCLEFIHRGQTSKPR